MTTMLSRPDPIVRPRVPETEPGLTACRCGQALDCCHAAHCPRCGVAIAPD